MISYTLVVQNINIGMFIRNTLSSLFESDF